MSRTGKTVVAWTGHRPDLFRDPDAARQIVDRLARELADSGAARFLVGGQRGVDTWAALAAMAHDVPFSLLLPVPIEEFAQDWSEADRRLLLHTSTHAADVRVLGGYTERNQHLAREADVLVAVWTRTAGGGTAETIEHARQAGTPIREIVLDPSPIASSATGRGI
jgi:predicted Rossmann-fold nucleotide-binding protein